MGHGFYILWFDELPEEELGVKVWKSCVLKFFLLRSTHEQYTGTEVAQAYPRLSGED